MTIEKKMNFVLVPFKIFKNAKTRLRKDLSDLDTEYIVKYLNNNENRNMKKYSFWDLLKNEN